MTAISLRAAPPRSVLRFNLSILASLLLHVAVFWPLNALIKPPVPAPVMMLEAVLLEPPVLKEAPAPEPERTEPEQPPVEQPATQPASQPVAVPPAPTFVPKPPEPQAKAANAAMAEKIKQEYYPREAIARGIQGDVVVLVILKPSGEVTGAMVATSSGHAILDEAAMAAALRITGLPAGQRQLLLPVQFRLD
jgi:periplasmic protein TonB